MSTNLPLLQHEYPDPCRNQKERTILLIEPNYRNKYPPLGLMKLSAYHKQLGDTVRFFKGNYSAFLFKERFSECMAKIFGLGFTIEHIESFENLVSSFLKYRRQTVLEEICILVPSKKACFVKDILYYYASRYKIKRNWDRVYITTLFTFDWKKIIEAVEFGKKIVKDIAGLYVGGVAASLNSKMLADETGLIIDRNIITGLLDKSGILDDNDIIIDELIPDYSILETVEYHYPLDNAYLTYTTKGCTRKCEFCAVPILEPVYKPRICIQGQIRSIARDHGEKQNLVLMDNNVLGSPKFPEIIQEIQELGFVKGATFIRPNRFNILMHYLQREDNKQFEQTYLEKIYTLLNEFDTRIKSAAKKEEYHQLLVNFKLNSLETCNKENLVKAKDYINEFIEKYRNKSHKRRYVDFNQGLDCRYLDEEKMCLLSQISIDPMRIAFDKLELRKPYEQAVRLAVKYGIHDLSNYLLYNYLDKPHDLWERMNINIELNRELNTRIYSFPMKYIPVRGEQSKDRSYIGQHWNRKYLRAIQVICNVTKGIIMTNPAFFAKAFGSNIEEFYEILIMPEDYIFYRSHFEDQGNTEQWRDELRNLTTTERKEAEAFIHKNDFNCNGTTSKVVTAFLRHYQERYKCVNQK